MNCKELLFYQIINIYKNEFKKKILAALKCKLLKLVKQIFSYEITKLFLQKNNWDDREMGRNKKQMNNDSKSPTWRMVYNFWNKMSQGNIFTRHWISRDKKASLGKSRLPISGFLQLLLTWDSWPWLGAEQVPVRLVSGYAKLLCC